MKGFVLFSQAATRVWTGTFRSSCRILDQRLLPRRFFSCAGSVTSNIRRGKASRVESVYHTESCCPNETTFHHNPSASSEPEADEDSFAANEIVFKNGDRIPIVKGDFSAIPRKVQCFIAEKARLMRPRAIFICDGSEEESECLIQKLVDRGMMSRLTAYENNYIVRTDPKDVARVESKTWIVTPDRYQTECHVAEEVSPLMGHWMDEETFEKESASRFPGCMNGRTMFVIPYSMGPIGGPLSKIGIQLTDSNYVVLCMRIMTRISPHIFRVLGDGNFVRCIHSVGLPLPVTDEAKNRWPCNPEGVLIAHRPDRREIWSFGSGYGGNSLLGKKCFALRIASNIARDEGWMAEHMLIMGLTNPQGKEYFLAAAFPSACGKTNLAMLEPTIPGWKVRCIGDDIAWMHFAADGQLRGINPECGFFGVAPGTSKRTNPMAVATFQKNSIFTNVAETAEGEYFWEGLENEVKNKTVDMIDWLGKPWHIGDKTPSAHPNSRFTAPARQCPIIHPKWESPEGVPIDAIIFGGRRPSGVPLVFETYSWNHGIFTGMCLKSEATAAAEHKGRVVMHDPMAMRPFMGYNFGRYLKHWVSLKKDNRKMPKIYHVNWFRRNSKGDFLWPGFGENIRVIDWIIRRLEGEDGNGVKTPIGIVPKKESLNLEGLDVTDINELLSVPADYWKLDAKEIRDFIEQQVGPDLPIEIRTEMEAQEERINAWE